MTSVFDSVKPTVPVRRLPTVLEAVPWLPGDNVPGVTEVVCDVGCCPPVRGLIETLEGDMYIQPGYWVITGVDGEQWGVRPDIFHKTYEFVQPTAEQCCEVNDGYECPNPTQHFLKTDWDYGDA